MSNEFDMNNFGDFDLAMPGDDAASGSSKGRRAKKDKAPRAKKERAPRAKKEKAPRAKKERARRGSSGSAGRRPLIIAAALGLVAVGVAYLSLSSTEDTVTTAYELRAARDINPGLDAPAEAFEVVAVPIEALEDGAIVGISAEQVLARANGTEMNKDGQDVSVVGRRPLYPVVAGQTVRPEAFSRTDVSYAREIKPNERLVSISASASTALGGALVVGERVDVVVAFDGNASVAAQDVEIVGISADESAFRNAQQRQNSAGGEALSPGDVLPSDPIPGIYTMAVPSDVALALVAADASNGASIYLVGRADVSLDLGSTADSFADRTCNEMLENGTLNGNQFCMDHILNSAALYQQLFPAAPVEEVAPQGGTGAES